MFVSVSMAPIAGAATTLAVSGTLTSDANDITQPTINTSAWTGVNLAGNNFPVGNTFITGTNVGGYRFDSLAVSLQTAPVTGGQFRIQLYTVAGTTATSVFTATVPLAVAAIAGDHLVFTSTDGFILNPGSNYAFTITSTTGDSVSFNHNGVSSPYTDGTAIRVFSDGSINFGNGGDMTFNLGLTAIPEPTAAALLGMSGLGLLVRRRARAAV